MRPALLAFVAYQVASLGAAVAIVAAHPVEVAIGAATVGAPLAYAFHVVRRALWVRRMRKATETRMLAMCSPSYGFRVLLGRVPTGHA